MLYKAGRILDVTDSLNQDSCYSLPTQWFQLVPMRSFSISHYNNGRFTCNIRCYTLYMGSASLAIVWVVKIGYSSMHVAVYTLYVIMAI